MFVMQVIMNHNDDMTRNLDTALLRTFVAVADSRGMSAAAKVLNMTQGAVSQQVKRLEQQFGDPLFVRGAGGARLAPAGERLIGRARRMLQLNDEIWSEMTASVPAGRIRLGVPFDLVGACLAPVLKAFVEAHPRIELLLVCGSSPDLAERLEAGAIDLAVIEEPLDAAAGECLGIERLVWVGARAGSAHRGRPLPISLVTESCAFRPVVMDALRRRQLEWRTVFENGGIEATTATVRSDLAITAWLAVTVPPDLEILAGDSGLPELPSFAISLRLARHAGSPAVDALVQCLREGLARRRQAA